MKVWDAIGRYKSDKAHLIGISMTTYHAIQIDAARAVLQAAINLGYSTEDIETIRSIYIGCGYDVTDEVCGDGQKGKFEECDGSDIGNVTCIETGCNVGKPSCTSNCTLDFSTCLADPEHQIPYEIKIVTDDFGLETMWDLRDSLDTVINSGGPYVDALAQSVFLDMGCLEKGRCYQFTIYDEFSDGICCTFGNGDYDVKVDGMQLQGTDPTFIVHR